MCPKAFCLPTPRPTSAELPLRQKHKMGCGEFVYYLLISVCYSYLITYFICFIHRLKGKNERQGPIHSLHGNFANAGLQGSSG